MTQRLFTALLTAIMLAACSGSPEIRPMIGGEVDDFEDGDSVSLLGMPWESIADGGETTSTIFVDTQGSNQGSVYHLTVGGTRPVGSAGNQVSGARTRLSDGATAVDASTYDGLELSMRELQGMQGTFIVQLATASVSDFDYYNAYVGVNDEWTRYRLPFSSFKQEGFGQPVPFTAEDLTHIAVFTSGFGPYTLAVDDVRFYRVSASPVDSTQTPTP